MERITNLTPTRIVHSAMRWMKRASTDSKFVPACQVETWFDMLNRACELGEQEHASRIETIGHDRLDIIAAGQIKSQAQNLIGSIILALDKNLTTTERKALSETAEQLSATLDLLTHGVCRPVKTDNQQ